MRLLTTLLHLLPAALAATSSNPDDPTGTILYVTEPACGFFRCTVTWNKGSTVAVNWINPPQGYVSVALASNVGGATYPIVNSYPAISQPGYCDAGAGPGVLIPGAACGMLEFVVPAGWSEAANYTIVVQSLNSSSVVGYTDAVTIAASNTTNAGPAGTAVSLLTIPAPTSTDAGASTSFTGTFPAPTAVSGGAAASSGASGAKSSGATSGAAASSGAKSGASTSGSKSSTSGSSSTSGTNTASAATTSKTSGAGAVEVGATFVAVIGGYALWGLASMA